MAKRIQMIHYMSNAPLIIWCSYKAREDNPASVLQISETDAKHMMECIEEIGVKQYSLCAYASDDWNGDYSPWPADNPMDSSGFTGNGNRTRELLYTELEEIKKQYAIGNIILTGYSLAGLFSLWMGLSCDIISDIICCSGSMWFDGFQEYLTNLECSSSKRIYLSLGGKEKRTGNPVMQTIEDKTREVVSILATKSNVQQVHFELNPGGHFADSCKRIANGVNWIINNRK